MIKKIKQYPHFDAPISIKKMCEILINPKMVASHKFFPFIGYFKKNRKFSAKKLSTRSIRYGARIDAYILAHYREILNVKYESILKTEKLDSVVIAYRSIPIKAENSAGRSNVHFADDAINEIDSRIKANKNCVAIALDIKDFFGNINHKKLKLIWQMLLGKRYLPDDHKIIFNAITNYKYVDKEECYIRLGFLERVGKGKKYIVPFSKMPKKLCSNKDFREKICGQGGKYKSIIKCNDKHVGIPQGAPISDLLSNMYLFDFDKEIQAAALLTNSFYRRYSDDILLITDSANVEIILGKIKQLLLDLKLTLNKKKSIITNFHEECNLIKYNSINLEDIPKKVNKPFEYLGFSYDGGKLLMKNQVLSRYYRKISARISGEVRRAINISPIKTFENVKNHIDKNCIFKIKTDGKFKRSFMSYVSRSARITNASQIKEQLKNRKKIINKKIDNLIRKLLPST